MDLMEPLWIMYTNWLESKKKQDNSQGAWKYQRAQSRDHRRPHQGCCPWWLQPVDAQGNPARPGPKQTAVAYAKIPHLFELARRLHEMRWQKIGVNRIAARLR